MTNTDLALIWVAIVAPLWLGYFAFGAYTLWRNRQRVHHLKKGFTMSGFVIFMICGCGFYFGTALFGAILDRRRWQQGQGARADRTLQAQAQAHVRHVRFVRFDSFALDVRFVRFVVFVHLDLTCPPHPLANRYDQRYEFPEFSRDFYDSISMTGRVIHSLWISYDTIKNPWSL